MVLFTVGWVFPAIKQLRKSPRTRPTGHEVDNSLRLYFPVILIDHEGADEVAQQLKPFSDLPKFNSQHP